MIVKTLRKHTSLFFDVHLMIENPDQYLEEFKDAGADMITIHQETTKHLHRTIQSIKSLGIKAGVSLNPATSVLTLEHILGNIEMVLLMSVNPGFGGQTFIPETLEKIKKLRALAEIKNPKLQIQVDGGINKDNAGEIIAAGADILVAGSAVFGAKDREKAIKQIKGE